MVQKLPRHLRGPFTVGVYNYSRGEIHFKRPSGEVVSTTAYRSFFIDTKLKKKFPFNYYKRHIYNFYEEGKYTRIVFQPTMKRELLEELQTIAERKKLPIYEADVNPIRRWISDTGTLISQKFRSLFFDLETHPLEIGFHVEAKRNHRIISFAAYDQEGNSWFYAAKENTNAEESKLIRTFINIARNYDTLLAWNGDEYDFFVLKERAKIYEIRIDWRTWNLLDYMNVVKRRMSSISDPTIKRSFALDSIGENVLGIRKIKLPVPYTKLYKLLGKREAELEKYNRKDVEIMLELEKKREFLSLHYALCSLCRTFPNRSSTFPNELADGILLRMAVQEGHHFPTRNFYDYSSDVAYEGAYVMNPVEGFHTNIQVPDFASLYPNIIISWNMSNETLLGNNEYKVEHSVATATGARFRTDIEGIIPKALKQLVAKRGEYNKRAKQFSVDSDEYRNIMHLSTAVKVATNSFYGLLGYASSRYHNNEIARSVTLTGQLLIREVIKYFETRGFKTVAGDTDSVFVQATVEQLKKELTNINNIFIPELLKSFYCREHSIIMDFDKGYKSLLIVTKKRYAGKLSFNKGREVPDDAKPEIKGLEVQRSDQIRYAQKLQTKYINLLLDPDIQPHDIDTYLHKDGEEFFTKELPIEEIEITEGVSKHPSTYKPKTPVVRVAEWLINEGYEFFVGMKIPYFVVADNPVVTGVHTSQYKGSCDRKYYWSKRILPPIKRLIDARFPNYSFGDFNEPRQGRFYFTSQAKKTKVKKTKRKMVTKIKKKIRSPIATIIFDQKVEKTGGVSKAILRLAKSYPGKYKLKIIVRSDISDVIITTKEMISMECLSHVKKIFPFLEIDPKPITEF
jgi:DNA polymerase elongation subunit (family B)